MDGASSPNNFPMDISINSNEAFKYIGLGGLATGIGVGTAKILKVVPLHSRFKLATIITGIAGTSFTSTAIVSEFSSNRVTRASSIRTNLPDVEFDGVIKFGEHSIKTKINDNEVHFSELKRKIGEPLQNVADSNISSSSNTSESYYTITDSHNIPSMLENGDLVNIIHNNPYLKLEFVLLFVLGMCLSSLFSLTAIIILNKYGDKLNNYFTNKYILMYINYNKKYLNVLIWIWLAVLYFIVLLALYITYNLIYYYEDYLIESFPSIVNSFIIFGRLFKNKKSSKIKDSKISYRDIKEAMRHTDLSFWNEDEKDYEFFLERDKEYTNEEMYSDMDTRFRNFTNSEVCDITKQIDRMNKDREKERARLGKIVDEELRLLSEIQDKELNKLAKNLGVLFEDIKNEYFLQTNELFGEEVETVIYEKYLLIFCRTLHKDCFLYTNKLKSNWEELILKGESPFISFTHPLLDKKNIKIIKEYN